jgi:hypothetical protein
MPLLSPSFSPTLQLSLFLFSKRDIPLTNYRTHTLHCVRNLAGCRHCPAKMPRAEVEAHYEAAHAIKVCDQCGISVEAGKLHDHRVSQSRLRLESAHLLVRANDYWASVPQERGLF